MYHTTKEFWKLYYQLPEQIQDIADKNFQLLKSDRRHPSLQYKKVGGLYSVRIGLNYRALALEKDALMYWFWIGSHDEYMRILNT